MTIFNAMTDSAVITGEYITFKHVKTRKVVILEIEIPEELFQDVITKLGMPIGGESKPVAIALLNISESEVKRNQNGTKSEVTEDEKLRIRAVLLCKDSQFQEYINTKIPSSVSSLPSENECAWYIKKRCSIKSRSELATNIGAQAIFRGILRDYKDWQLEIQYADNLSR